MAGHQATHRGLCNGKRGGRARAVAPENLLRPFQGDFGEDVAISAPGVRSKHQGAAERTGGRKEGAAGAVSRPWSSAASADALSSNTPERV